MQQLKNIKNIKMRNIKSFKKQAGFSLMEGMFALLLFGSLMVLDFRQSNDVEKYQKAQVYSNQTLNYATKFSNWLQINEDSKQSADQTGYYQNLSNLDSLKSQLIKQATNNNVKYAMIIQPLPTFDNKSMYNQKPCLLLYYDNTAGQNEMMGLMYYAGGKSNLRNQEEIVTRAVAYNPLNNLGYFSKNNTNKTGINFDKESNGVISLNNWNPKNKLINFVETNACVYNGQSYYITPNSLMFNMQLFTDFNNKLISNSGLQKSSDQTADALKDSSYETNSLFLPNSIFNNNTLKSNLKIGQRVIMQESSSGDSVIALGTGANDTQMLNFGKTNANDNDTAFLTSAIQPSTTISTGTACLEEEVGKVLIANRETVANEEVARNVLTCSRNKQLCSTGFCYLPIKPLSYTFSNPNGVENPTTGQFKCPNYAPYIEDYFPKQSSTTPNVDIFRNNGFNTTAGSVLNLVKLDDGNNHHQNQVLQNQNVSRYYRCTTGGGSCYSNGKWSYLELIDFSSITQGNRVSLPLTSITTSKTTINTSNSFSDCTNVCSNLNGTYGSGWQDFMTVTMYNADTNVTSPVPALVPTGKCACARIVNDWFYGIALIEDTGRPHLTSVTCSNYPKYNLDTE